MERQMTVEELEKRFKYHPPTQDQIPVYEETRRRVKELAEYFRTTLPESREKALAFTELENAQFWANSAVARRS